MGSITYTLDLGIAGELDCDIDYRYSPGRKATMYARNGDPGDPAEPAEIYVLNVMVGGVDITPLVMDVLESDSDFLIAVDEQESEE